MQFCSWDKPSLQFILPMTYRQQAMRACHDDTGHLGLERSLDLLKDIFYWPGMNDQMENHIWNCDRCLHFKSKPQKTKLYPITATHLLELIHMDFPFFESGQTGKDVNTLIVTDHYTWYVQTFIILSQTAQVVAQTLWDKFFMHYGSHQGCNFESKLIAELCELSKTKNCKPLHTDHSVMASVNVSI